ncbi:glycosyltransferase family 4 protein [uncultured Microbacterium sp.]|uniref:glycosyltransferase family 4 protein n=1 Tax=uncultured Microbacterium sp. TaxID=191216 RepID=UPI00261B64DE|nr:glycosyltransferase family 4 protein [uncultured Microbacterium sp.]
MKIDEPPTQRVAIVATTEYHGGAEIYIQRLKQQLEEKGYAVTLFGDLVGFDGESRSIGAGPKWGLRTLTVGLLSLPQERGRLLSALNSDQPFAAFSLHFKREQIAYTRLLTKRARTVWVEHGTFPSGLFGIIIRPLYWLASRKVSEIVCVSELVARSIAQRASRSTPISVIESAVARPNPSDREATRAKYGVTTDARLCVFVGRLTARKRPQLAIEAALAASAVILVAGDGPERARLESLYRNNPDVHLIGQTDDVSSLLSAADYHLWTSDGVGEGFPTVLLEASWHSVPTVAASDSGFATMVKSAGGVVTEPDAEAMAVAILDDSEHGASGASALAWAKQHTLSDWSTAHTISLGLPIGEGKTDGYA